MSLKICDPDPHCFARAMQRKLERFYNDRFQPICITILGSTACLEFPVHYLKALNEHDSAVVRRKRMGCNIQKP
jgi:hypothetical protein